MKLLYGIHQKISTIVLKSKITEYDCNIKNDDAVTFTQGTVPKDP